MNTQEEMLSVLRETLVWTRVGFFNAAKGMLENVLDTDRKRTAYQAADGVRGVDSIRVLAKMSPNSVTELFKTCTSLGLMEQLDGGKRRRLFDLAHFGLEAKDDGDQQ